jgi:PadR family transcriptional regulator PadR
MRMDNGSGGYRERFVRSFLDWLILSILRKKPAYGNEMITILDEEFRVPVSPGSLYPILHNLEHMGLVKGEWNSQKRRTKKIYELTLEGSRTHRDGLDSIGRILGLLQRSAGEARLDLSRTDSGAVAAADLTSRKVLPRTEDDRRIQAVIREVFLANGPPDRVH